LACLTAMLFETFDRNAERGVASPSYLDTSLGSYLGPHLSTLVALLALKLDARGGTRASEEQANGYTKNVSFFYILWRTVRKNSLLFYVLDDSMVNLNYDRKTEAKRHAKSIIKRV